MERKEFQKELIRFEEQLRLINSDIYNFIWDYQEGQNDHFDNFNKTQQIAFIDLYSKVQALRDCLVSYNNWFVK